MEIMNTKFCLEAIKGAGFYLDHNNSVQYSKEDSPGLCYSSILQRFKITFRDSLGKNNLISVVLKSNPDTDHPHDSLFDKMFVCEIKMYQNVLPILKTRFDKADESVIWPKIYAIPTKHEIIMEDLKPDFKTNLDEAGSSLHEATLAVTSLAKFHAASFAAKEMGEINGETLEPYFYCRNDKNINHFFMDGLRLLAKTIRNSWDKKWTRLAEKFDYFSQNIGDVLMKLHNETEEKFKVINHGDSWRANLMFKYSENQPIAFRLVDFQLSHYGSFAWDLCYFFFINPNLDLMYKHFDELLSTYHRSMVNFLDKCGLKMCISFSEIQRETERLLIYGFLKCCTDLPYQIFGPGGGVDAENLFKNNEETEALKLDLFSSVKYSNIIKVHIEHLQIKNMI